MLAGVGVRAQSLSYSSGQNVSPAYEGWREGPDGSRYFLFGYMNRNWEEELNVARTIQQSLLPRRLPTEGWFRASGSSVPTHQVGGDYFDVLATIQCSRENEVR